MSRLVSISYYVKIIIRYMLYFCHVNVSTVDMNKIRKCAARFDSSSSSISNCSRRQIPLQQFFQSLDLDIFGVNGIA